MFDELYFLEEFNKENNEEILDEGIELLSEGNSMWSMSLSEFKSLLGKVADLIKKDFFNKPFNYDIGSMSSEEKKEFNNIFVDPNYGGGKHDGARRQVLKAKGITFVIYKAKNGEIDIPFVFFYRDHKNRLNFKYATSYLKKAYKNK